VVSDLFKMLRRLIGEDIDLLTITDPKLGKSESGSRPNRTGFTEPNGKFAGCDA
jgi:hypothetical protein